jgi:hypothetical protein
MAIEYSLEMVSSSSPRRIADLIRGDAEVTLEPLPHAHGFALGLPGLYCGVGTVDDRSAEIIEETYGIRPTVGVLFRIDSFLYEDAYRSMRDALVRILRGESGEVVLLANHELPILRRRDGHGVTSDQYGPWLNEVREALGPAWEASPDLPPTSV